MAITFDKLGGSFWHDGKLIDINFSFNTKGQSSVSVIADFYPDSQTAQRITYIIECKDVQHFSCSIDANELKEHRNAGNISDGYLKNNVLWIYLIDGLLEIQARKFTICEQI